MHDFAVNGRYLCHRVTGVQRYALEITKHLRNLATVIRPRLNLKGMSGHLWEQTVLPLRTRGRLLWSPSGTGPVRHARQVVTVHDLTTIDHPEWFSKKFARFYSYLIPRLAQHARRIITVSHFSKQRLLAAAPIAPEKIAVIHNGLDEKFQPASPDDINAVRETHAITTPYFLCVGSLEPRKNLRRVFEAWQQIQPKLPDFQLLVAGANADIYNGLGFGDLPQGVRLLGYVDDKDLPALYSGARAFVYPSLYEGFGLPPLEAMACGTPVVCSGTTSLPEVVGSAAILVNPEDIRAIADGILQLADDNNLHAALRQQGLDRAKLFTWAKAAELTLQTLREADSQD